MDKEFNPYHVCRRGNSYAVYKWDNGTKKAAKKIESWSTYLRAKARANLLNKSIFKQHLKTD